MLSSGNRGLLDDDKLEPPQNFRGKIKPEDIGRIIGGQEAVAHSWPWMVYLNFRNRYHCGGSLISNQFTVSCQGKSESLIS